MVAAALTRPDGRWLMHRRPAHKHHGGLWEFPGGKVEPGETPLSALVRELEEELGVAMPGAALRPLAFAGEAPGGPASPIVILLYTAEAFEGEPRALEDGAAVQWFRPEEIAKLPMPPLDRALCAQVFAEREPPIASRR